MVNSPFSGYLCVSVTTVAVYLFFFFWCFFLSLWGFLLFSAAKYKTNKKKNKKLQKQVLISIALQVGLEIKGF